MPPPPQGWNRVSYDTDSSVAETLPHKESTCAGRVLLLPFMVFGMLFTACGKETVADTNGAEDFDPHPTWTDSTNNFWEKGQRDSSTLGTTRENAITKYF